MTTSPLQESRRSIGRALILACVFMVAVATVRLLTPDRLDPQEAQRLIGVLIGALLAVQSSMTPKLLPSPGSKRCDPVAEQALRRFVGWSLTLGGVGYAIAWMLAPIDWAKGIAVSMVGASLLVSIIRVRQVLLPGWRRVRRSL